MTDLKPCPFCGVSARIGASDVADYIEVYAEHKPDCLFNECSVPEGVDMHVLTEKWNTRTSPPVRQKQEKK